MIAVLYVVTGAAAISLFSCASRHEEPKHAGGPLEPATTRAEPRGGPPDAARAQHQGIIVTAHDDVPWPGDPEVLKAVTPLLVVLRNDGTAPVYIQYQDFELAGDDGARYQPIPPFEVEPVSTGIVLLVDAPVEGSKITHERFEVAPHLADVYPDVSMFEGPFPTDAEYFERAGSHWTRIGTRPAPDLTEHGLPEGVLQPDGHVSGYLYFEPLSASNATRQVTLRVELEAEPQPVPVREPFLQSPMTPRPGFRDPGYLNPPY